MKYRTVKAEQHQAELVAEIINHHELTIDPESTPIGVVESLELLEGFFDPASAAFLIPEGSETPQAFYSVNPDANRKKLFTDIYARPGSGLLRQVLAESLKAGLAVGSDYEHWFGVNSKDTEMKAVLESHGMGVIRSYWNMRRPLEGDQIVQLENQKATIRVISGAEDMGVFWRLHQDAFSNHFAFAPRAEAEWVKMTLESSTYDPEGTFLLDFEGEPAGFVQLATANYHLNGGFVALIGVAHKFQGGGLGELLLQHAINISLEQKRDFIELNVDRGNESGALRLYEKLKFKPNSVWEQYENKNWVEIAKGL